MRSSEASWWDAKKEKKHKVTEADVINSSSRIGYFINNEDAKGLIQCYLGVLNDSENVEEFKKKWKAMLPKKGITARTAPRYARIGGSAASQAALSPSAIEQQEEQALRLEERERVVLMREQDVHKKDVELEKVLNEATAKAELERREAVVGNQEDAPPNPNPYMVDAKPDMPLMIGEERNPAVLEREASRLQAPNHDPYVVDAKPASTPPVASCNCGCRCVIA